MARGYVSRLGVVNETTQRGVVHASGVVNETAAPATTAVPTLPSRAQRATYLRM